MPYSNSWWAHKVRQFRSHIRARVGPDERAELADWLTPPQLVLFDSMHVADRRHGLDVVATLRYRARIYRPAHMWVQAAVSWLRPEAGFRSVLRRVSRYPSDVGAMAGRGNGRRRNQ